MIFAGSEPPDWPPDWPAVAPTVPFGASGELGTAAFEDGWAGALVTASLTPSGYQQ